MFLGTLWIIQTTTNIYLRENVCKLLGHSVNNNLAFVQEEQVWEFCTVLFNQIIYHTQSTLTPEIFTVVLMFALLTRARNSISRQIAKTLYYGGYFGQLLKITKMTRASIRAYSMPEKVELRAYGVFSMSHAVCCEVLALLIDNNYAPNCIIEDVVENMLDALYTLRVGRFNDVNIKYLAIRRILECLIVITQKPVVARKCLEKGLCMQLWSLFNMSNQGQIDEKWHKLSVKQQQLTQQMVVRLIKTMMIDNSVLLTELLHEPQDNLYFWTQSPMEMVHDGCRCSICTQQLYELQQLEKRVVTLQDQVQNEQAMLQLRLEETEKLLAGNEMWSIVILHDILSKSIEQNQPLIVVMIIEIAYRWCEHSEISKVRSSQLLHLLNELDQKCQNLLLGFWGKILEGAIEDESVNVLVKGRILSYFLTRVKNILINDEILQSLQQVLHEAGDVEVEVQQVDFSQRQQINIARSYIHAIQEHLH
eukprot:TRINITY_DN3880_c0_g1_i7.p1 TRINITY_DN3880_c0_g1~~TRINITY_DN3880_c0_g1_i7.p1  ORF type:complete len:478 (-),score=28.55 TRINITY_DN3880_c0_g1_i7:851-2284(-)